MTNIYEKRRYKQNIVNYLNFLNKIIDDQVSENDLLSLDETQVIRSKETKFTVNKSQNFSVNEFKSNGNFNLFDIDGSLKFYVWVEETNICGATYPRLLESFSIAGLIESGADVIVLLAEDLSCNIIIDIDIDENMVEVEFGTL